MPHLQQIFKKTKPAITWPGGKTRLLDKLLPLIPEHTLYVEAFGGGLALLYQIYKGLGKRISRKVAQARLAPHERSKALAYATQVRTEDGAALPISVQTFLKVVLHVSDNHGCKGDHYISRVQ